MPWLLIHSRDRGLLLRGVEAGAPMYTRDVGLALCFAGQAAARTWIEKHTLPVFGELVLMRTPGRSEGRRGVASHYGPRVNP
jgi:hypothetical protein